MIDPKLISLLKVYETGNYTRAARQLSLTQPAVSQHIRALEQELGVRIFERANNELHVTNEGRIVIKYARRMQSLHRNLQSDLENEKRRITQLKVGITHTAESNAIAEALARYATRHEGVNIQLRTDTIDNLCDMLRNYEIDFAVAEGKISDPSFRCLLMDTDSLVLVVAPEHPLAGKNVVTVGQLMRERLILRLPDSSTSRLFVSTLESRNLRIEDFNVVLEVDNIATIKDLVRRNFGVSILPKSACMDELRKRKIAVLPIENLSMLREINLFHTQDFSQQMKKSRCEAGFLVVRNVALKATPGPRGKRIIVMTRNERGEISRDRRKRNSWKADGGKELRGNGGCRRRNPVWQAFPAV